MLYKLIHLLKPAAGATAIEYALIASLISIVIVGSVTLVGTTLDGVFTNVAAAF